MGYAEYDTRPRINSPDGATGIEGNQMQQDIVGQGVELMLYGMGTVVVFLAALVVATTAMSRVVTRFFPEPVTVEEPPARRSAAVQDAADPQLVAVISAAIAEHRARRKG